MFYSDLHNLAPVFNSNNYIVRDPASFIVVMITYVLTQPNVAIFLSHATTNPSMPVLRISGILIDVWFFGRLGLAQFDPSDPLEL